MKIEVFKSKGLLRGKTVFLSASKPSREPFRVVRSASLEIDEAVRALARSVFAEEGRLVFGAHPTISPLIVEVATEYFRPRWDYAGEDWPVLIYQSDAFRNVIPAATRKLKELGYADILQTARQNGEEFKLELLGTEQCLESLAHMRYRMFAETHPVAMVAAGGMQGVVREARLFLDMFPRADIYVLPTTGGATERLEGFLFDNQFGEPAPKAERDIVRRRLIPLETHFGDEHWRQLREPGASLPAQPYDLLMQRMVREIGGARENQ